MTILEANKAAEAQAGIQKVTAFSKSYRGDLESLEKGESFTIPNDYTIFRQLMMRNGEVVKDRSGNDVYAEFINVETSKNRTVRFYPSSLGKTAFCVDAETGKDLKGSGRIVRTKGAVAEFVRGKDIDSAMTSMKGCTILLKDVDVCNVRTFGVSNEEATKDDVTTSNVGTWEFKGSKKPVGA